MSVSRSNPAPADGGGMKARFIRRPAFLAGMGLAVLIAGGVAADYWTAIPMSQRASYVGRDACLECHQDQANSFLGSHHDLAMDRATDETVLADFNDVAFEHHGVTSRFFRDGDRFMVNTEGESGEMEDFEVKYVFGVEPLQQYMVEFDRTPDMPADEVSRLQVLRLSWDTAAAKWFYLAPPDVDEKLEPDDPLHWTGTAQRWQIMCADCHSTNLKKNFDVAENQYHTTFSEIDVSCESCHGPGSLHVQLATGRSLFWDRNHGYALAKLKGEDATAQLETCAPCHSRRAVLDDSFHGGDRYHDHYQLETLTEATYHDDGQIKDEVYVFGSFVQSKMYHKGIRCTDCHDPHSLKLKHPGNETCTSCHQHAAGKYDVPSHHHHEPGTAGAMCVNCHMPHTRYMAVDDRRDHSLRVPRPDLSVRLGTPNACSQCHVQDQLDSVLAAKAAKDTSSDSSVDWTQYANWLAAAQGGDEIVSAAIAKTDKWCDEACEKWYGEDRKTPRHFVETLAAIRRKKPGSTDDVLTLLQTRNEAAPDIVRASALRDLLQFVPEARDRRRLIAVAREIAGDVSETPIVRAAAISVMQMASPTEIRRVLLPLIDDPTPLVAQESVRSLVYSPAYGELQGSEKTRVDLAMRQLKRALMMASDRAGAHMAWASLCERIGDTQGEVESYQTAIRLEPDMAGPRRNLAHALETLAERQPPKTAAQDREYATKLRAEDLPLLCGRDGDRDSGPWRGGRDGDRDSGPWRGGRDGNQ
ncbi:MAG: multiheme c-type cytochrome, partial [Planctomycetota bacterium]